MKADYVIIVPAYNEEKNIGETLTLLSTFIKKAI